MKEQARRDSHPALRVLARQLLLYQERALEAGEVMRATSAADLMQRVFEITRELHALGPLPEDTAQHDG